MDRIIRIVNPPDLNPSYDLCGEIIGLAMKVHRNLGFGFLESVYRKALASELQSSGHRVEIEFPVKVWYGEQVVGDFYADMLVDETIVVELKAIERLAVVHEVQVVNYLTATHLDVGLLLNFGSQSLEFRKKFRRSLARSQSEHSVNSVQTK